MVSLDSSIIPALVIFISLVVALNFLLFQPLMRIQAERARRTSGSMDESREKLDRYSKLMESYQAAIRNGRMEGYRRQEQIRSEAKEKRTGALERARLSAEQLLQQSREQIENQVREAKANLSLDAQELAAGIASAVLKRPA
jgi:F-type H+-transporting ATPase subunit b